MVVFGCYYPPSFTVKAYVFQTKYEEVGDFREDRDSLVFFLGLFNPGFIQFSLAQKLQTELREMIITGVIQFKEEV